MSLQVLGMLLQSSGLQVVVLLPRKPLLSGRGGQTSCMFSEELCGYFIWAHTASLLWEL